MIERTPPFNELRARTISSSIIFVTFDSEIERLSFNTWYDFEFKVTRSSYFHGMWRQQVLRFCINENPHYVCWSYPDFHLTDFWLWWGPFQKDKIGFSIHNLKIIRILEILDRGFSKFFYLNWSFNYSDQIRSLSL